MRLVAWLLIGSTLFPFLDAAGGKGAPPGERFDDSNKIDIESVESEDLIPAEPEPKGAVLPIRVTVSVELKDRWHEGFLQAGQGGELIVRVTNGDSPAWGLTLVTTVLGTQYLTVPARFEIGDLAPRTTKTVRVPVQAHARLADGTATIEMLVEDAKGFDCQTRRIHVQTRALRLPKLKLVAWKLDDSNDGVPAPGEQLILTVTVENSGSGSAIGTNLSVKANSAEVMFLGPASAEIGVIPAGGRKGASFSLFVRNSYRGPDKLPFLVSLAERKGPTKTDVEIGPAIAGPAAILSKIVAPIDPPSTAEVGVDTEVDKPLPVRVAPDPEAVAIVIGIEQYSRQLPQASFALRDAARVKEYFRLLFGIAEQNFRYLYDYRASKADVQTVFEGELPSLVKPGKTKVFVYFAGHGLADPSSKQRFLVPFDGNPSFIPQSCYPLCSLIEVLGRLELKEATVFLDSCFSGGASRPQGPIVSLTGDRRVDLESALCQIPRNTVVFAGTMADQIASSYAPAKHGTFTFELLRILRTEAVAGRQLTVRKLHERLLHEVPRSAKTVGREQTPVLLGSAENLERVLLVGSSEAWVDR